MCVAGRLRGKRVPLEGRVEGGERLVPRRPGDRGGRPHGSPARMLRGGGGASGGSPFFKRGLALFRALPTLAAHHILVGLRADERQHRG